MAQVDCDHVEEFRDAKTERDKAYATRLAKDRNNVTLSRTRAGGSG